jgi:uncharacterized protein YacL
MKVSYNYTDIKKHEKRIYSISGTKISNTGITSSFIKTATVVELLFNFIGIILCIMTSSFLYSPFKGDDFDLTFDMIFIGIPIGITFILRYVKIGNYKMQDYLTAYFKPKRTINQYNSNIKLLKYKQDTFIENVH